ncbi:MAG: hypothetical protein Fur0026_01090 [Sideroxydans sp.]
MLTRLKYMGLLLLLLPRLAAAVTYANTATTFSWIDATSHSKIGYNTAPYKFNGGGGCGTTPPTLDDTLSDNIPIGFTFMYSGVNFTQVRVMSNGRLQFNNNTTCGYGSPVTQLPYPNANLNYTMRIYGNDLDPTLKSDVPGYPTSCLNNTTCYVSYATLGSAPYRSFVVTWSHVPEWAAGGSTSGDYNLQIILQENGEFIYQYGANTPGPQAATAQVGWQADNASGDYDVPAVGLPANNTAIKFYIAQPVAEYRMEQPSWNGTAGEVLDTSGNGRHATAIQAGTGTRPQDVAGGKVCRGGQISENTTTAAVSALDTGIAVPTTVGNSGTLTFWYNNSANTPNATRTLFDATTTNNRFFYLQRTNNRALTFRVTDSGNTNRTVTTANNTLPSSGWSHIAVSWTFNNLTGNSDRLRIWVDGVLKATSAFNTTNVISGQIGTLYLGDNRSNNSPAGRSAGNPGGTNATLDEFRLYNFEGGAALINRDFSQTGACLSHYAISHAGSGQACQANNVTITAHDNAHNPIIMPNNTTQITLSTSTGQGDWSLVNGYGVLNNGTPNDGNATYLFNGEYQAVFALNHSTPGTVNLNVTDGQIVEGAGEDPDLVLTACFANFNACHDYPATHCSAATGKLYTRLAGIHSGYDVVALDGSDNVATTFTGKAVVSLVANKATGASLDAHNCFVSPPDYTQVLDNALTSFTAGRLTLNNINVPDAYRDARLKMVCDAANCPPSGMTWCSVNNFAIRPQAFGITVDLGGATLRAGWPFSMTAASGTTTYDGTPVLDTAQMRDHNNNAIGTFSGAFPVATGGNSIGTSAFYYHDVGTISLLTDAVSDGNFTSVDQPNDCVMGSPSNALGGSKYGCLIGSAAAGPFGRFYPDHLTYSATLMPACSGFTYMDQPGLGINLALQAFSLGGLVTTRYTAGYSHLGTFDITGDNGGTPVTLRLSPALPAFAWNNGSYTVATTATFTRDTAPDGPFDSFALKANILSEPDGVAITGSDLSNTTSLRYGRIKVSNEYGSSLLPLNLPVAVQYFNGSDWASNTLDSCTPLSAANFAFAFSGNLAACETAGNLLSSPPNFTLRLAAPGSGNEGNADLTLNLGASGIGHTCTVVGGPGPAETPTSQPWLTLQGGGNPTARATFGIYKGNNSFIYFRENY